MEEEIKKIGEIETPQVSEVIKSNPVGRPSEYENKIVRIREYKDIFEKKENIDKLDEVIPTIEGLACYVPMARKTVYLWLDDNDKEEFLHIIEWLLSRQGKMVLNNGLNNKFNSTIAKLLLSKHGYVEKSESDITSKGESIINGINYIIPKEPKKDGDNITTELETTSGVANIGGQGNN